jgi:hypothetical protein
MKLSQCSKRFRKLTLLDREKVKSSGWKWVWWTLQKIPSVSALTKYTGLQLRCAHGCHFNGWSIETSLRRCLHGWRMRRGIFFPNMGGSVIFAWDHLLSFVFWSWNSCSRFVTDIGTAVCILVMQRPGLLLKVIKCPFSKKICRIHQQYILTFAETSKFHKIFQIILFRGVPAIRDLQVTPLKACRHSVW